MTDRLDRLQQLHRDATEARAWTEFYLQVEPIRGKLTRSLDALPALIQIALKVKLGEEVTEFLLGGTVDELADVWAVVKALALEIDGDVLEVAHTDERGGLYEFVMMYGRHPEFDR